MARKQRYFQLSVDLSIGFNQYSDNLKASYQNLLQQNKISMTLSIPLLDWGRQNRNCKIAQNTVEVVTSDERINILQLEQKVKSSVADYNLQLSILKNAERAIKLSDMQYNEMLEKFKIGACSMKELREAMIDQQKIHYDYMTSLRNCWVGYYQIRQLTLYDFISMYSLIE